MNIFFYIISILILFRFLYVVHFYYRVIKKWKLTKGEIQSYKIDVGSGSDAGWEEQIIYEYTVNIIKFTSNKITNNFVYNPPYESWVRYYSKLKLREGQIVDVFYNPKNVRKSIIDNTFDYRNFILLFFAVLIFVIATQID